MSCAEAARERHRSLSGRCVGLVVLLLVTGCSSGPGRSTTAFCSTLHAEKARILQQFGAQQDAVDASNDSTIQLLGGVANTLQLMGELRAYLRKLADVAPDEIRTETEIVRDEVSKQFDALEDAATNPLAAIASGLLGSLMMGSQLEAVNQFALANCGEGM